MGRGFDVKGEPFGPLGRGEPLGGAHQGQGKRAEANQEIFRAGAARLRRRLLIYQRLRSQVAPVRAMIFAHGKVAGAARESPLQ